MGTKKRKLAVKRAQDLLARANADNRKTTLNSYFSCTPAHFQPASQQRELRTLMSPVENRSSLNLYTLNMMRLFRRKKGLKVAICCMPKSGSTYLMTSLVRVKGLDARITYVHVPYDNPSFVDAEGRENELDELGLLRGEMMPGNFVTQAHLKSSIYTDRSFAGLGYKVIVVQRNIFDCLVSMDDMIHKGEMGGFGMFRPPATYREMDREDRLNLITRYVGPWYIDFAVSWVRTQLKPLYLSYEQDVLGFSEHTVEKIRAFLNIPQIPAEEFFDAFKLKEDKHKKLARLNKAVAGRGQEIPEQARLALLELAKPYEEEVRFFEKGLL